MPVQSNDAQCLVIAPFYAMYIEQYNAIAFTIHYGNREISTVHTYITIKITNKIRVQRVHQL